MPTLEEKKSQLESLKNEIKQAEASLESDFATFCTEQLKEEDENLFFEDRKKFILKILQMQNDFLKDKLAGKVQQAQELHADINAQEGQEAMQAVQEAFMQKHPDANMEELINFYNQDIPPRFKAQLDQLEGVDFYEALYQAYQSFNAGAQEAAADKEPLPQRLNGQAASPQTTNTNNAVMDRF